MPQNLPTALKEGFLTVMHTHMHTRKLKARLGLSFSRFNSRNDRNSTELTVIVKNYILFKPQGSSSELGSVQRRAQLQFKPVSLHRNIN